jgi:UDP-N-acetylmuramate dehydrogenase
MIDVQQNICLAPFTTLRVGGNARFFTSAATETDVVEALGWARERSLPVFVLGGGSNLLISDSGFPGLVIRIAISGIDQHAEGSRRIFSAGAGVEWDELVALSIAENCAGLECLSGIPGIVGGTPIQNVGAYGQEVASTIVRVHAVEASTGTHVEFDNAACAFRYRQSRFNGPDLGRFILTRVDYALTPSGAPSIAYADLKRHFAASASTPPLSEVREAVLSIRRAKGMVVDESDPDSRSAGSFFKNPVVTRAILDRISDCSSVPVPHYDAGADHVKLSAAWLIEQSGIARGFALGPVAVSRKHTLALVNLGHATAADVLKLKSFVQRRVQERFGVELHPEPVMLGFETSN